LTACKKYSSVSFLLNSLFKEIGKEVEGPGGTSKGSLRVHEGIKHKLKTDYGVIDKKSTKEASEMFGADEITLQ
jgi:hypothetical protein